MSHTVSLFSTPVPDGALFEDCIDTAESIRSAMLGSIRTRYVELLQRLFCHLIALQLGTRNCCWSYRGME